MTTSVPSPRLAAVEDIEGEPADAPDALRVVIVAASRARLGQLTRLLAARGLSVAGVARDAVVAQEVVTAQRPAVILVDLDLDAGGLEVVEQVMASCPTPIVVCGAAAARPDVALAAGAVDVVGSLDAAPGSDSYLEALERHLRMSARVRVIRHPRARLADRRPLGGVAGQVPPIDPVTAVPVLAIGASTGGPPALATVLAEVPVDLPAAVVVVQHMAEGFLEGLGRWLAEVCPLPVVMACDGERLRPGVVHLAPAARNLTLTRSLRVQLSPPRAGQFHVPGVDDTFASVAEVVGSASVGVLLTGMGRDGAAGLLSLRSAGAHTIGQDEATSVVWGMPGAAKELGGVIEELPLARVGAAMVAAVQRIAPAEPSP